jgi:hypothetical protein
VRNKSNGTVRFGVGYEPITQMPGVSYTLSTRA